MLVEQLHLRDGRGAHKTGALIELWAHFHATRARDAAGERVRFFLVGLRLPRPRAEIVCSVYWYPGLHTLQVFEEHAAIDGEIAHDWELTQRLELHRLVEFVDQRRARHLSFAVHQHGAGAADLFQAIRIVSNRGRSLALAVDR